MTTSAEGLRKQAREIGTDDPDAALELYDRALAAQDATPVDLAVIRKDKAVTLTFVGRVAEAVELFTQVIERHRGSADAALAAVVDKSLYNKAVLLSETGSNDDAIALLDEVVDRNGLRTDVESRRALAEALLCKASIVQGKGTDETVAESVTWFRHASEARGNSRDPALTEIAARALLCEAFALFAMRRGFVQSFSWWSRRVLFKRIDSAIDLLAALGDHDSDSALLLASRAVGMKFHFLNLFGFPARAEAAKKPETLARRFGPERGRRIAGFMEVEQNLRGLAAFSGTESFGVML